MNIFKTLAILMLTLNAGAGCDADAVIDDDGREVSVRSGNGGYGGVWLNTSAIGSQAFSEMDLTGALHDGVQVTGIQVKGPDNSWINAHKTEVTDGTLRIMTARAVYTGAALVGARWKISLVNELGAATPREIWIADVNVISAREARYTFQTRDDNGQVIYLCEADALGSHAAAVIKDVTIDPFTADMAVRKDTAYFACTSGAVGKAITWGYRPWERPLPEFATAVRVVRADYCFDGMSWTESGTAMQVKDRWNVNTFLSAAAPTEVVWTKTGIACLTQPRAATYAPEQVTCNGKAIPSCPVNLTMSTYPDTQFWTKLAPQ
jgi:hypothetical protein